MKIFVFLSITLFSQINFISSEDDSKILSRKKRYLVFPEGSSLTSLFCITLNLIEVPTAIFTDLINLGINYDLPNSTIHFKDMEEPQESSRRRYRRNIYNKIEIILDATGFDGKTCVYRALCEAAQIMKAKGDNLLEEIIRRLFMFPLENIYKSEPEDHKNYHWAHRKGHEAEDCKNLFPNCHISLLEIMLGYKKISFDMK